MDDIANGNHQHTNHCDSGCERLTAEGEVAVARLILDGGDLEHVAKHVGSAVGTDPTLPEAYEVLAELVGRAGGPQLALDLFPQSVTYAGSHACRAALLAAVGRTSEAVFLLGAVIGAVPDLPRASAAWLEALATPGAAAALDPAQVGTALAHVTQAIADPAPEPTRSYIAPYYALVREVVAQHPGQQPMVAMASSLARRMDNLATAITWAKTVTDLCFGPDREAIDVMWKVVREDPSQTTLAVDLAETLGSVGRPAEGVAVLERVLKSARTTRRPRRPSWRCATSSTRNPTHLVALHDHLRRHPGHSYAGHLLQQVCADKPWLGRNDYAREATVNGIHQMMERLEPGTEERIGMHLSGLEAPSSVLAARPGRKSPGFLAARRPGHRLRGHHSLPHGPAVAHIATPRSTTRPARRHGRLDL